MNLEINYVLSKVFLNKFFGSIYILGFQIVFIGSEENDFLLFLVQRKGRWQTGRGGGPI